MRRTRRNRNSRMRTKRGGMWPFGPSDTTEIDPTTGQPKKSMFSGLTDKLFGNSTPAQNDMSASTVMTGATPGATLGGRRRRRRSRRRR